MGDLPESILFYSAKKPGGNNLEAGSDIFLIKYTSKKKYVDMLVLSHPKKVTTGWPLL